MGDEGLEAWEAGEGFGGGDGLVGVLLEVGLDDGMEFVGDGAGEKEVEEDLDLLMALLGEGLKLGAEAGFNRPVGGGCVEGLGEGLDEGLAVWAFAAVG